VPSLFILSHKIMHHRYGRHGPRAWLRQRERRYTRPSLLPVPVVPPTPTIIHVFIPATAERIIFIIMSDGNAHEAWGNPENIQLPEGQMKHLVTAHTTTPDYIVQDTGAMQKVLPIWERVAIRDASDDIDAIKDLQEDGHFIIFEKKLFERRVRNLARKVTDDYLKDPTVSLGHEALRLGYQEAYLRTFEGKKHLIQAKLVEIMDDQEKQLRATLSDDRLLVQNRAKSGDWHARDLVLVRILQTYYPDSLEDIDVANMLLERHTLIDNYTDYVFDFEGKREVSWPKPDSF
jgi:hypothetical protein